MSQMKSTPPASSVTPNAVPVYGVAAAGVTGAIISGSASAAREIRKVKAGEVEKNEAVKTVAKDSLSGGLAVAAGVTVAKLLFRSNILGTAAMIATSVGVLYAIDGLKSKKAVDGPCCQAKESKETDATAEPAESKTAKAVKKDGK